MFDGGTTSFEWQDTLFALFVFALAEVRAVEWCSISICHPVQDCGSVRVLARPANQATCLH